MRASLDMKAQSSGFVMTRADARAEKGERKVMVARDQICIARRYLGMNMRVSIPAHAFRGVALSLQSGNSGGTFYQVTLVHEDSDLSVVLEETLDDRNIVADWTRWSRYFTAPRLVERSPGQFEAMDRTLGGITQGEAQEPRRTRLTRQRRGRFAARRHSGQQGRSETVFANEREIICYE